MKTEIHTLVASFTILVTASLPVCAVDQNDPFLRNGCYACHNVDRKILGPAFKDVAAKYQGDPSAVDRLVNKVRNGGSGVWGPLPMVANNNLDDQTIRMLVQQILDTSRSASGSYYSASPSGSSTSGGGYSASNSASSSGGSYTPPPASSTPPSSPAPAQPTDIKELKRQADSLYAQKGDREAQKQAYDLYGQIAEQATDKKLLADVRAKMKKLEKSGVNKGGADGGMPSADSVMAGDSKNCPQDTLAFMDRQGGTNWRNVYKQLAGGTCGLFVLKGSPQQLKELYANHPKNQSTEFYVGGNTCFREYGIYLWGDALNAEKYIQHTSSESFARFYVLSGAGAKRIPSSSILSHDGVNIEDASSRATTLFNRIADMQSRKASGGAVDEQDIADLKVESEALGCAAGTQDYAVAVGEAINYYKTGGKTVKWYGKTIDPNKK